MEELLYLLHLTLEMRGVVIDPEYIISETDEDNIISETIGTTLVSEGQG